MSGLTNLCNIFVAANKNEVVLNLVLFNGVFWGDWYSSCTEFLCVSLCLQMVSGLFLKHSESLSQQRSNMRRSSTARRYQANTVSAKFQTSLQELLDKMERFGRNTHWSPACMGWLLLSFQLICSSTLQINWNCGLNCCCGHEPLSYIKWIYWWLIMAPESHRDLCQWLDCTVRYCRIYSTYMIWRPRND